MAAGSSGRSLSGGSGASGIVSEQLGELGRTRGRGAGRARGDRLDDDRGIAGLCPMSEQELPGVELIGVPGEGEIPPPAAGEVLLTYTWGAPNLKDGHSGLARSGC